MIATSARRHRAHRVLIVSAATVALAAALAGCRPEPEASPSASATATASQTPTATATPTPSSTPNAGDISLPASCDDIYSASMRATLDSAIPPLNDPGVTMYSTENAVALEILNSGIPSLRCTWGTPSETGIATTIAIVDADQSARLADTLAQNGFACTEASGGTLCTSSQTLFGFDGEPVEKTESHFLRGNGWVSTELLSYPADGYTEDIAATLWG